MPATPGGKVVELFISEAWEANYASRYSEALAVAERAVEAAERLSDAGLLVRALYQEAWALRLLGDQVAAMVRCSRILTMAADPQSRGQIGDPQAAKAVCQAYTNFVSAARARGMTPPKDLLKVLDAADSWLSATGHLDWRAGVLLQRAELHTGLGDSAKAVDFAQEALVAYAPGAPGPSLAYHHNCLGRTLVNVGRYSEAITYFQAVLDAPKSSPFDRMNAHRYLAERASDAGQADDANRHADAAVKLAEECSAYATGTALVSRGEIVRALGRYEEALTDFGRAVEGKPDYSRALAQRGETLRLMRRYEEALADLNLAIELDPGYTWAIASRGQAHRGLGRYEQALADFDRAIELDPGYKWAITQREETRQLNRADQGSDAVLTSTVVSPKESSAAGESDTT